MRRNLQKAIFIGVFWGIGLMIFLASLAGPQLAYAATQEASKHNGVFSQSVAEKSKPAVDQAVSNSSGQTGPQATENTAPAAAESCSLGSKFPEAVRRWCSWIEKEASQNGLDPNLVAAVMLQESGGDPKATSHSGAIGLLQVMPRDGLAASFQCVNGPCFASRPGMAQLYDPEFNLQYGAGMLGGLVNRHGSLREALRAYGPGDAGYSYADTVLAIYQRYGGAQ